MSGRFEEMLAAETARGATPGRALVPITEHHSDDPMDHFSGLRANFLAHLIATRDRLPQTLSLRRAAPDIAADSYAAAPGPRRRTCSRMA
jgi:hypothetical protein